MIKLDIKIKQMFFDTELVKKKVADGTRRALSKIGAFVRKRMRSSIRRTQKSAAPGMPPRAHSGNDDASLKKILFGLEGSESVVIGPVKLNSSSDFALAGGGTVPELMEFGGQATLKRERNLRDKKGRVVRTIPAGTKLTYAEHPFAGPALDKEREAGTIPAAWAGTVRA